MGRKKLAVTVRDINSNPKKTYRPITKLGEEGRAEQRAERGKIARLNKGRANRMESKIAKFFVENGNEITGEGGRVSNRVIGSGALGGWKGDVIVELKNNPGKMLIECKLSSAYHNTYLCPQMRMEYKWLTKLQEDVATTGAKWGVLVIHFHNTRDFYTIIRREDLELLRDRYHVHDIDPLLALPLHDWQYHNNGQTRTGYTIIKVKLQEMLISVGLSKAARFLTPHGEYIIMSLTSYRDLIADI